MILIKIFGKIARELYRLLHPSLWGKNLQINGIPRIYDIKGLKLGKNVSINSGCVLQCYGGLTIENNVTISDGVKILTRSLDIRDYKTNALLPKRDHVDSHVKIGLGVWIAANAIILPGVSIANYCIIAAGSIVTRSIEREGYIYAGVPAKPIRKL